MPAPHQCRRRGIMIFKMSHFWDLSFFQECVLHPPSWACSMTSGTPDKLWLKQLNAEKSLYSTGWVVKHPWPYQALLYDSVGTMTVIGTSVSWSRWQKDNQSPLTALEHSQLHRSPSGTVQLLLEFLKYLPNLLETPGANKMGYFQDENFAFFKFLK